MNKIETYRDTLRKLAVWDAYLLAESGLPGPRGNIELAQAVAEEGDQKLFKRYLEYRAEKAPVNSPYEFFAFCGVVGLGRLLAEGDRGALKLLRHCASDNRWRIREGVAMALQRWGSADMQALIIEMRHWMDGNAYEQRAAVAALCEPRLLSNPRIVKDVLGILDQVTFNIKNVHDRHEDGFIILRKGLGYCWSVAVAALPNEGKILMEKWSSDPDHDIRWIMKENLKKNRLARLDVDWVEKLHLRMNG